MKYYFYISETKVNMLYSQLKEASAPKSNRKYKLGVSGIGAEFGFSKNEPNIYMKLKSLLKVLENKNMLSSLKDENPRQGLYYQDSGYWHNGLFTISHFTPIPEIMTYTLMRRVGYNLILLIGSPKNILGNIEAIGGIQMPDTSGGVMAFQSLFSSKFISDDDLQDEFSSEIIDNVEIRSKFPLAEKVKHRRGLDKPRIRYAEEFWAYCGEEVDRQKYIGGMISLCESDIAKLPNTPIECVFKLFSTWSVDSKLKRIFESKSSFFDIRSFSIGSPIYTAIP